jgi:hypothetical protein
MVISVCICGPSPMRIAGWRVTRSPTGLYSIRNEATGETHHGEWACWWTTFMWRAGHPMEHLDRRAWVWNAYDFDFNRLYVTPDPRPYPYPEAARSATDLRLYAEAVASQQATRHQG